MKLSQDLKNFRADRPSEWKMDEYIKKAIALEEAIEWFAENPDRITDDYPCHANLCSKEKCGRCGRAIAAWKALRGER